MIRFGIRQSFDRIDQIKDRYANIGVPVEVALPYYWDIYEPVRLCLGERGDEMAENAGNSANTGEKGKKDGKKLRILLRTFG